MDNPTPDPIHQEVMKQLRAADSLSSTPRRLGGFMTLLALGVWCWWQVWAADYISTNLLIFNISRTLSLQYQNDQPSTPHDPAQDLDLEKVDLQTARQYLAAKRQRAAERAELRSVEKKRKIKTLRVHQTVQAVITASWTVLMTLNGVFMLCAAVAGLTGSVSSRKWHRLVVYWTVVASLATFGGVCALTAWGGFPPPNYALIAQVAALQCAYAFMIVVALLLTRRMTFEWVAKVS